MWGVGGGVHSHSSSFALGAPGGGAPPQITYGMKCSGHFILVESVFICYLWSIIIKQGPSKDIDSSCIAFMYRVEEKYASAPSTLQNNNFLGNPFLEFKLWLIPEVTLHSKVAFGKKYPFSLTHGLWRMPITAITNIQKAKKYFSHFHT